MKCIIPVAGAATRLLPVSKTVPKFMMPLGNKPLIQYSINECLHARITEIIFVVKALGNEKQHLIDYFDLTVLSSDQEIIYTSPQGFTCTFEEQTAPKGLGDAIYFGCAHLPLTEKFLVLLPDDVFYFDPDLSNPLTYANPLNPLQSSLEIGVAARIVSSFEEAKSYGVIQSTSPSIVIEEKPAVPNSRQVIYGRYLLQRKYVQQAYDYDRGKSEVGITSVLSANSSLLKIVTLNGDNYLDCGNIVNYSRSWKYFTEKKGY